MEKETLNALDLIIRRVERVYDMKRNPSLLNAIVEVERWMEAEAEKETE